MKILILIQIQVLAFWMKERRNKCNHNLHLLQSNISTNFHNYWIYFNRAGTHLQGQPKVMYFHIFALLLNMDINRCQGRVKFQSLPSIQICFYYLNVSLKTRFWFFFSSVQLIIYNQYFDYITKFFIICSLKMFLPYSTLPFTILAVYLHYLRDFIHMTSARKGRGLFQKILISLVFLIKGGEIWMKLLFTFTLVLYPE